MSAVHLCIYCIYSAKNLKLEIASPIFRDKPAAFVWRVCSPGNAKFKEPTMVSLRIDR